MVAKMQCLLCSLELGAANLQLLVERHQEATRLAADMQGLLVAFVQVLLIHVSLKLEQNVRSALTRFAMGFTMGIVTTMPVWYLHV